MMWFEIQNTLSCSSLWGMDCKGQKRGCGQTCQKALAVVQEGNDGSLNWRGGNGDGERSVDLR